MDSVQPPTLTAAGTTDPQPRAVPARASRRRPPVKIVLFGLVLLGLLGIVALATVREIQRHSIERRRSPRTLQSLSSALGWPAGHLAAVLDGRMQAEPASRDNVLSRLDRVERQLDDITGRLDALRADLATVLVHVRAGR